MANTGVAYARTVTRWGGCLVVLLALSSHICADTAVWTGEGVPQPQPVTGDVTLGVYIFPGWYRDAGRGDYPYRTHDEDSEWRLVARKPAPRPLLGFYDDSLPEVNDWHIKWALEHGISFFCFDWYWNAGEHRLLRTLEQGFLKAKYCSLMKFCIHWCNHGLDWKDREFNRPKDLDFQTPALVEMTEYLADNYFRLPNYLTVDGRPVLVIWDTRRILQANGGPEGFAKALEEMNRVLRDRGIGDLYLVTIGDIPDSQAAGFSARTDYGCYGADFDSEFEWRGGYSIPYETMMAHQESRWRAVSSADGLPYMLSIGSNWDSRPRAGDAAPVITGKTPEKFAQQCRTALSYIDGRTNLAIIEAWNEWGEGSFIEPDKECGFGMLDAVRETFTDAPEQHTDLVPSPDVVGSYSVLMGQELADARAMEEQPYPDPPRLPRSVKWEIDVPLPEGPIARGWEFGGGSPEGWMPYQVEPFAVAEGILKTTALGDDPQLIVDNVGVPVEDLDCIALRLRTAKGVSACQLFWTTLSEPSMSADKAIVFKLVPDGKWHTYLVRKQVEGKWSGPLKILRLDIGGAGDPIELDWVRLYRRAG